MIKLIFIILGMLIFQDFNAQVEVSPRIALNWQLYDFQGVNGNFETQKPITMAVGLVGRLPLDEKNYISLAFNAYPIKASYVAVINSLADELATTFDQVDFRFSWDRRIGSKTLLGIGIELVHLFNVERYIQNRPPINKFLPPDQRSIGFEFSLTHKIKKVEVFADIYIHLHRFENYSVFYFESHQKVQIGVGIPFGK